MAGMAAAHRLVESGEQRGEQVEVRVLEARDRMGGSVVTTRRDGYLIEGGPDSFITQKPWGLALCRRLGIEDEIIQTNPACRRTFIARKGRLYPVPEGFLLLAPSRILPFVRSRLFSWPGKMRMGLDLILPARDHGEEGDESLASFVRRRFGSEALERIAQPLVGGVYTADPETLSLRATMPRFLEMEANHRSLILAMRRGLKAARQSPGRADSGARYSMFVSLASGMSRLIEAMASRLPRDTVLTRAEVRGISRSDGKWRLELADGRFEAADAVILTCPAYVASRILRGLDRGLASKLDTLTYASSATLSMAFRREQIGDAMDGFGFVVPVVENRTLIAVTYNSVKFAGRAPEGKVLMRAFLGGALQPAVYDMDDGALQTAVLEDLRSLIGLRGKPEFAELSRWPQSMPQYPVGHLDWVADVQRLVGAWPGLQVAGNAYDGVGIPDCVHSGEKAAEQALAAIAS